MIEVTKNNAFLKRRNTFSQFRHFTPSFWYTIKRFHQGNRQFVHFKNATYKIKLKKVLKSNLSYIYERTF